MLDDSVLVRFELSGDLDALALPESAAPSRRDELWRHTCFELFLRAEGAPGYLEFNLAPSGDWAAYAFDGYRSRTIDPPLDQILIDANRADDRLIVTTLFTPSPALPADQPWRASLTAVVETRDGGVSYWAVAHPEGRPDFHHADGFFVGLPAFPAFVRQLSHPERP